ncbi:MAG: DUF6716 putative glycosyltransferase [Actinomycetes bacterium]
MRTSVRVLAVADSDSYLKWSVATLAALPVGWRGEQVLVASPVAPSANQVRAAAGAVVPTLSLGRLLARILRERPDVVLLACTGPVVEVLAALPVLSRARRRPVLVTGLPGVHDPPTVRAVRHRARCDVFLAHSHAEVEGVAALAEVHAPGLQVALARLPFLGGGDPATQDVQPARTEVVFAAQATVPGPRAEREAVLRGLAALHPPGTAVVKLRAGDGEAQTHHEPWPYPALWRDLVARGEVEPGQVRFRAGSMAEALNRARALVTVSSTAALEAIGRGVPVAVLRDFGVSPAQLNQLFVGSGCLATLEDVRAGRFPPADPGWAERHYFHPRADDDWEPRLRSLLDRRAAGGLAARRIRPSGRAGSPWRRAPWRRAPWRWVARLMLPRWALRRAGALRAAALRRSSAAA